MSRLPPLCVRSRLQYYTGFRSFNSLLILICIPWIAKKTHTCTHAQEELQEIERCCLMVTKTPETQSHNRSALFPSFPSSSFYVNKHTCVHMDTHTHTHTHTRTHTHAHTHTHTPANTHTHSFRMIFTCNAGMSFTQNQHVPGMRVLRAVHEYCTITG